MSLLKKVDAVLVKVPSLQEGIEFYCHQLGHELVWQKDEAAGLKLGDCELVISTTLDPETDILVDSVHEAVEEFRRNGGQVVSEPEGIEVGNVAVVKDPFGNHLTLVDLSKGLYQTDSSHKVIGVQ